MKVDGSNEVAWEGLLRIINVVIVPLVLLAIFVFAVNQLVPQYDEQAPGLGVVLIAVYVFVVSRHRITEERSDKKSS